MLKKWDETGYIESEQRGKHENHKKIDENSIRAVVEHINSFQRIESHYCRARTKKEYLDGALNLTTMYRMYKEQCVKQGAIYVKKHY